MKYLKTFEGFREIYGSNRWVKIENRDLLKLKHELFNLVYNAYKPLGGNVSIKFPNDVLTKSYWEATNIRQSSFATATIFGNKNKFGIKIGGIGHDNCMESKEELIKRLTILLNKNGYYIEASGNLAKALLKLKVNIVVDKEKIQKLFPSSRITFFENGSYRRTLPDGKITDIERIFGKPMIKTNLKINI